MSGMDAEDFRQIRDAVRRLVREGDVDTVFSFLVHANTVAALASRRLPGVRFLQSIQTVQPRPRWHWRVQRVVQRYAAAVVVPSTAATSSAGKSVRRNSRCGYAQRSRCPTESHFSNACSPTLPT